MSKRGEKEQEKGCERRPDQFEIRAVSSPVLRVKLVGGEVPGKRDSVLVEEKAGG